MFQTQLALLRSVSEAGLCSALRGICNCSIFDGLCEQRALFYRAARAGRKSKTGMTKNLVPGGVFVFLLYSLN